MKNMGKIYNLKNRKDFENLYRQYWKKLYTISYSKTKNIEVSEEIVQDIFISLWKRRNELKITSSLENYLIKATKLKVIDFYRKQYRNKETPVCNLCEHPEFDKNCLEHNEALFKFLEQDLQLVVNQLPCQCQKVYRLSREKQMSINEISTMLDISSKTVKNHLTKALSFVRKELKQTFNLK